MMLSLSCGSKTTDPIPEKPQFVKANAGPTSFEAKGFNNVNVNRISTADPDAKPHRMVIRANNSTHNINLTIVKFTGVGTYKLFAGSAVSGSIASYSENSGNSYNSQNMAGVSQVGEIVVSEWSESPKHLKGTFNFSGRIRNSNDTFGSWLEVKTGEFDLNEIAFF